MVAAGASLALIVILSPLVASGQDLLIDADNADWFTHVSEHDVYSNGAIAFAGRRSGEWFVGYMNPQHVPQWCQLSDSLQTIDDVLFYDDTTIVVTGLATVQSTIAPPPDSSRFAIVRMKTDGSVVWTRYVTCPKEFMELNELARDSYGNIIVSLAVRDHTIIVKLDADGGTIWSKRFDMAGSVPTRAITVTLHDRIIGTGNVKGRLIVYRLSAEGDLEWLRSSPVGVSSTYRPDAVTCDSEENVYIGGYYYAPPVQTSFVSKYAFNGVPEWQRFYNSPTLLVEVRGLFAVDADVVLTGNVQHGNLWFTPFFQRLDPSTGIPIGTATLLRDESSYSSWKLTAFGHRPGVGWSYSFVTNEFASGEGFGKIVIAPGLEDMTCNEEQITIPSEPFDLDLVGAGIAYDGPILYNGVSTFTAIPVTVTQLCSPTMVREEDNKGWMIGPNPFRDVIGLTASAEAGLLVTDARGRVVHQSRTVPAQLDASTWAPGVYLMEQHGKTRTIARVIKLNY